VKLEWPKEGEQMNGKVLELGGEILRKKGVMTVEWEEGNSEVDLRHPK
jgi:hypothetical protein